MKTPKEWEDLEEDEFILKYKGMKWFVSEIQRDALNEAIKTFKDMTRYYPYTYLEFEKRIKELV